MDISGHRSLGALDVSGRDSCGSDFRDLQFRDTPQRLGAVLTGEGIATHGKIIASNRLEGELWSQTEERFCGSPQDSPLLR